MIITVRTKAETNLERRFTLERRGSHPFLLVVLWLVLIVPGVLAGSLSPSYLRCEYRVNPLGIDETQPRLSWIVESGTRGARQTAYRILVAGSPETLGADTGDLWDTGKVLSNRTAHIVYSGSPLLSRTHCWWKVRVWDENDSPSEWSPAAHWSMGLLAPGDWQADWIGLDNPVFPPEAGPPTFDGASWIWNAGEFDPPAGTRYFRKTITISPGTTILEAEWLLTVDDQFTAWVNGVQVGQSDGEENAWMRPQLMEITNLSVGENVLAVEGVNAVAGPAGVLGKLVVTPTSGPPMTFVTDGSWKGTADYSVGWTETGFDDGTWAPVLVWGPYGMPPWYTISFKTQESVLSLGSKPPSPRTVRAEPPPGGTYRFDPQAEPWDIEKVEELILPPPAQLRKTFTVEKTIRRAMLYVTALGLYEVHLNGSRVGDEYLAPGWTSYNIRVHYRAHEVTSLLQQGDNCLGALLADGWYAGYAGFGRDFYGTHPRLLAQLEIEYTDDTTETIVTDGTWKGAKGPIQYADIFMGEYYDARFELPGWDTPLYNDYTWQSVNVSAPATARIQAHPGVPIRKIAEFTPVEMTEPLPGTYIFNLGQNIAGFVRLRVTGPAGTTIVLRHGETLYADGTLNADNLRAAVSTDTYVCRGGGEEVWEPRFTSHGFQYVEVTGYPGVPDATAVVGIAIGSDTPVTGSFECSNPMVNQLFSNVYWTQRMNFADIPTDCPQRDERLGWLGDAQIFSRTSAWNTDVDAFFTKWLYDVNDARYADGAYIDFAPHFVGQGAGNAAWADAGIVIPWTLYRVYGDTGILERWYDNMVAFIDYCERESSGYIRPAVGYGDWVAIDPDTPLDVISTAYFAYSTGLMEEVATALGRTEDAVRFSVLRNNIRAAFNSRFVDAQGHVTGQTQTCYVLALEFDLLPEPQRTMAIGHLVNEIVGWADHLSTGFVGTRNIMTALSGAGRTDVAYTLLLQDTYPSWLFLVSLGATSTWEYWNDYHLQSHAHYVFGCVGNWMYKMIGGIDTIGPGFEQIRIRPEPGGDLVWARCGYDSIQGPISTEWSFEGDFFNLDVTVPTGATAEAHIPSCDPPQVWEGPDPANMAEGVTFLRMEDGAAVYEVLSGSYSFRSRIENCDLTVVPSWWLH